MLFPDAGVGDAFSVRFTYDTDLRGTTRDIPGGTSTLYTGPDTNALTGMSLTIGGTTLTEPFSSDLRVTETLDINDSPDIDTTQDIFRVTSSFRTEDRGSFARVEVSFIDNTGTAFNSTALPGSIDIDDFSPNVAGLSVGIVDGQREMNGEFDFVTSLTGPITGQNAGGNPSPPAPPADPPNPPLQPDGPDDPDAPGNPDGPDGPGDPEPPLPPTPGDTQDNPILPNEIGEGGEYTFDGVPSGTWIDPPVADGFEYTLLTEGETFTSISGFPEGFLDGFNVSVDGELLGTFDAGDTYTFGDGVTSFVLDGINPDVLVGDPDAFPLRLTYSADFVDLMMRPVGVTNTDAPGNVIPTPAALPAGLMLMLALANRRRRAA